MNSNSLAVNEMDLGQLQSLCRKYPASSVTMLFYLKMLQRTRPEEYQIEKAQGLLRIINRAKFAGLQLDNAGPERVAEREPVPESGASAPVDKNAVVSRLIAEFEVETPKIQFDPERHDGAANYSKPSLVEDTDLVSETLAVFYAKQGYPGKAIKIYKKLCLLFPEKSCYFAAQISEIKNSKNQSK